MKKNIIFFILLFLNSFCIVKAQTGEKRIKKLYLLSAVGGNSHGGINYEIGIQAVVNNRWSAAFSYQGLTMKPETLPADYIPATGTDFWGETFTIDPTDVKMKLLSLSAGKYFHLGRTIWLTSEVGISLVKGDKASFQPATIEYSQILDFRSSTSNYRSTIVKKTTLGGMLRADINWAFSSFMGLGAGVFANFNSIQLPIGFQARLTLGLMGQNKK